MGLAGGVGKEKLKTVFKINGAVRFYDFERLYFFQLLIFEII